MYLLVNYLVINPKGLLQLLPHLLLILLDHELGRHGAEQREVELALVVGAHLHDGLVQLLLLHVHAHHLEDHLHGGAADDAGLLLVEAVEALL